MQSYTHTHTHTRTHTHTHSSAAQGHTLSGLLSTLGAAGALHDGVDARLPPHTLGMAVADPPHLLHTTSKLQQLTLPPAVNAAVMLGAGTGCSWAFWSTSQRCMSSCTHLLTLS